MKIDATTAISKIVTGLRGGAAVLESFGIDYSCAGERSLGDAARAEGVAPEEVVERLRALDGTAPAEPWNNRSSREIVKHLVNTHHRTACEELATIVDRLSDLCDGGGVDPDLLALRTACAGLSDLLTPHLREEESEIFPAVAAPGRARRGRRKSAGAGPLRDRMERLMTEHGAIAEHLRAVREIRLRLARRNPLPPRSRPVLERLARLEAGLHEAMFLENAILYPRALAMKSAIEGS